MVLWPEGLDIETGSKAVDRKVQAIICDAIRSCSLVSRPRIMSTAVLCSIRDFFSANHFLAYGCFRLPRAFKRSGADGNEDCPAFFRGAVLDTSEFGCGV